MTHSGHPTSRMSHSRRPDSLARQPVPERVAAWPRCVAGRQCGRDLVGNQPGPRGAPPSPHYCAAPTIPGAAREIHGVVHRVAQMWTTSLRTPPERAARPTGALRSSVCALRGRGPRGRRDTTAGPREGEGAAIRAEVQCTTQREGTHGFRMTDHRIHDGFESAGVVGRVQRGEAHRAGEPSATELRQSSDGLQLADGIALVEPDQAPAVGCLGDPVQLGPVRHGRGRRARPPGRRTHRAPPARADPRGGETYTTAKQDSREARNRFAPERRRYASRPDPRVAPVHRVAKSSPTRRYRGPLPAARSATRLHDRRAGTAATRDLRRAPNSPSTRSAGPA